MFGIKNISTNLIVEARSLTPYENVDEGFEAVEHEGIRAGERDPPCHNHEGILDHLTCGSPNVLPSFALKISTAPDAIGVIDGEEPEIEDLVTV